MNNVYTLHTVSQFLADSQNQTIILTNGCFDLLHPGHIDYLTKAKALGDQLIIGLNSDQSVQSIKGSTRPINNQQFRASMLLGLKPVDAVVIFDEDTPINLINTIKPSIHVKGGDYTAESLPEYPVVIGYGGEVSIIPFLDGYSSTSILDRMQAG